MGPKIVALYGLWLLGCGPTGQSGDANGDNAGPGVDVPAPSFEADPSSVASRPVILFLGTSLTAGYGLSEDQAFPALIQERLDSLGYDYQVVNAGVSGETSAGGLARLDWLLRQPVAVLVLELGANDGLRGLDVQDMRTNLQTIVDKTMAAHPDAKVVVAGMQAPPNMGSRFTTDFRDSFTQLAERNEAALIPFLLDSVAAIPERNLPDGIHPTPEGHRFVADNVWRVLEGVLQN